jgi:hypothetical protein
METVVDDQPEGWDFINPDGITSVDAQGRVHSGEFSVNIVDDAGIEQTIPVDGGGCFYILSFFARGEGDQVGFTAALTFETTSGPVNGGEVTVRQGDLTTSNNDFAFFQLVSTQAPVDTTAVTISFVVNATGGQSLDLDDVSLIAN